MTSTNPPALQLYTLRDQLAGDRPGVLGRVAALGYGAVEVFDVLSDTRGLRDDLARAGLTVCSVHATLSADQLPEVVEAARTLGTDTVIVPYVPPERFSDADGIGELARELNEAARRLAGDGMRLGYHNHAFELSTIVGGRPALEVLADGLDDDVLLEVDTYWAAVGGQDVPALLGRLGERVRYLHVKDGPLTEGEPNVAVGTGRMPVAEIVAASPSATWHIVEFDQCATDLLTAVGDSLAWLADQGLAQPVARGAGT
ncbi:sugar phosphate isomerase/epimerase family protein [Streptomyces collinus]|uniref:sugar phosphate isomerase/epimerase family protein n=1 Tax=Streptomyces collinus TaxID=42684 RepID=UPI0036C4040E